MIATNHVLAFTVGKKSVRLPMQTIVLLLIFLLGAAFRFWDLARWSLWIDEFITLRVARTLRILTEGIPDDQHPPLYYMFMHAIIQISDREAWLRLPSAAAGLLALPLMWRVGRHLYGEPGGVTAAALLALSPLHIWYSREARMYGIATFFWVASIFFYWRILKRDNWLDSFGLALTTLVGIFIAYPTLGLWCLEISLFWLFWYIHGQKGGKLLRWLTAQAVIALGFYFWWPFFQQQLPQPWFFLRQQLAASSEWPFLARLSSNLSGTVADTINLALAAGVGLIMVGWIAWLLILWRPHWLKWLARWLYPAALAIIILFILATIVGTIPRGLSVRRQLLFLWPPMILLAGWAFSYVRRFWLTRVTLALSFCLAVVSILGPPHEDWRGTTTWLMAQAEANDEIILFPIWIDMGFDYYYHGSTPYRRANSQDFAKSETVPFASGQRVWVVILNVTSLEKDIDIIWAWFEAHAQLFATHSFSRNIVVAGYEMQ